MLQIHERIKKERLIADLTEEELADKIGVKRSTYQYWETKTPSVDKIKKVAVALGKPEDYFFNNDENYDEKDENDEKDREIDFPTLKQLYQDLSSAHRDLSAAHRAIAESNKVMSFKLNSPKDEKVSGPVPPAGTGSGTPYKQRQLSGKRKQHDADQE